MKEATISLAGEIDTYMTQTRIPNNRWYVGITSDPTKRLFTDHNVSRLGGTWIYGQCSTADEARELEAAYHRVGCKGDSGGGDRTSVNIYAYVITSTTVE